MPMLDADANHVRSRGRSHASLKFGETGATMSCVCKFFCVFRCSSRIFSPSFTTCILRRGRTGLRTSHRGVAARFADLVKSIGKVDTVRRLYEPVAIRIVEIDRDHLWHPSSRSDDEGGARAAICSNPSRLLLA